MSLSLLDASLHFVGLQDDTSVYELRQAQFSNKYFILSSTGTRRLMAFPEVVGFDSYLSMLPATVAALRHLTHQGKGGDVDILTILRGGLNYPIEEACYRSGIRVRDIHFVSCERIIEDPQDHFLYHRRHPRHRPDGKHDGGNPQDLAGV